MNDNLRTISREHFLSIKGKLEKEGNLFIRLRGVSMEPLIKAGQMIRIVKPEAIDQLKAFDIVVFLNYQNLLVCHYYWQTNRHFDRQNVIATRPLNPLDGFDVPILKEDLLGIVTNFRIPWWMKLKIVLFHQN